MKPLPRSGRRGVLAMLLGLAAASCATLDPSIQAGRSDAFFAANVRPGGTQAEIERVLGPPDRRERYSISGNEGWDYKYQDGWGYMALYSITFSPDGHVLSAISNRINSGGDHK